MEAIGRKPFQGITNIVRFNWHFYVAALLFLALLYLFIPLITELFYPLAILGGLLLAASIFISLAVSFYVYDLSGLYKLDWLQLSLPHDAVIINIHAGFDETSALTRKSQSGGQEKFILLILVP